MLGCSFVKYFFSNFLEVWEFFFCEVLDGCFDCEANVRQTIFLAFVFFLSDSDTLTLFVLVEVQEALGVLSWVDVDIVAGMFISVYQDEGGLEGCVD